MPFHIQIGRYVNANLREITAHSKYFLWVLFMELVLTLQHTAIRDS